MLPFDIISVCTLCCQVLYLMLKEVPNDLDNDRNDLDAEVVSITQEIVF